MYVKITLFLRNAQFQRYMVIWYVIITLDLLQVFLNYFFCNRIPHYFDIHVVRSVTVTLIICLSSHNVWKLVHYVYALNYHYAYIIFNASIRPIIRKNSIVDFKSIYRFRTVIQFSRLKSKRNPKVGAVMHNIYQISKLRAAKADTTYLG